ncbi:hypothetical protein [Nitrosomonas communis]|uniref:Uncharacterized protein n=1 Tax=Nitrosomonas communis TaxID=44574 RepID=A0A1I4XGP8_9PROT|nr:hypothetical protein [Nitrosomonas communis]SFN24663.1 hypothetical protein SAMN05421863_11552 [Nitrosomonas communis]
MAAKPKLSPEQWANVRGRWEGNERKGFTWLVDELKLDVSPQAIRKIATREGWTKKEVEKTKPVKGELKVSKVTDNHGKVTTVTQKPSKSNHVAIKEVLKKVLKKLPVGRPTLYKEEYAEQAYRMCLLGAIDVELANFFGVNKDTIYEWKKVYSEFSVSIKKGKMIADAEVAFSLFKSATGQHYVTEDKLFDGKVVTLKKQIPRIFLPSDFGYSIAGRRTGKIKLSLRIMPISMPSHLKKNLMQSTRML